MKRILMLILCLLLATAMLASCDPEDIENINNAINGGGNGEGDGEGEENENGEGNSNGEHKHTFTEEWAFNATGHWHAATCEHTDELGSYAAHTDANYDGVCDICPWYDNTHTHTFSEEWSSDENNHWHVVSCEHTGVAPSGSAPHADEDKDGNCDTCDYVVCSHTYSELWTTDDNYHWNNATCGCVVTNNYDAHTDADDNGACDTCALFIGEVDEADILSVLRASATKRGALNGGVVNYTNIDGSVTNVTYIYGAKDTYIYYDYVTRNATQELWFNRLVDDTVFAVVSENGGEVTITTAGLEQMNGYNYSPSTLTSSDTLEGLLLNLYNLSQERTATAYTEAHDADSNTYAFTFNYLAVNYITFTDEATGEKITNAETDYYEVSVAFTYSADFVITAASLVVDAYSSIDLSEGEDQGNLSTVPKDYTVLDVENGIVKLEDGATKDRYTYAIAQNVGARTYQNPYSKAKILPTDFDLYSDPARTNEFLVGDTIYTPAGVSLKFYIGNIVPDTALYKFITRDDFTLSAVYADNGEAYPDLRYYFTFTPGHDATDEEPAVAPDNWASIFVNADATGRNLIFTLTYEAPDGNEVVKTINVIIGTAPEPEETVDKNVSGTSFKVKVTDTYNYVDEFVYTASAAGTYTFDLVDGETLIGFAVKTNYDAGASPEVDVFDPNNEATSYTIELDAGEQIAFYVGAAAKGIYNIDVSMTLE